MKHMNRFGSLFSACLLAIAALLVGASPALADGTKGGGTKGGVTLGKFAVLAGGAATGAVTCTSSAITGDVGVIPPGTFTQTTCMVTGRIPPATNADARRAYAAFLSEYIALTPKQGECTTANTLTGTLAGRNLAPGVYCVSAEEKTGTLTLMGNGNWTFKVLGALTGTNFSVVMAGGGQACNVKWWVDAAATMTTSNFQGTILAGADITVTGGTFNGNAWAGGDGSISVPTGAVTLTTGAIVAGCGALKAQMRKECGRDDDDDDDDGDKKKGKKKGNPFGKKDKDD